MSTFHNIDKEKLSKLALNTVESINDFWNKNELLESPIESIVFERLFKYKNHNAYLIPQETIKTISGNFRPDIILKIKDKEIAIECDGEEFHQNEYYDEWRDALILATTNIQSIFRLRGKDIYTDIQNIIYFIAKTEPDFFDQDLINRLKPSIRPEFINRDERFDCVVKKRIVYDDFGKNNNPVKRTIEVTWRNIERSFSRFSFREILISYLYPHKSIDELIKIKDVKTMSTEKLYDLFFEKYPEMNKK